MSHKPLQLHFPPSLRMTREEFAEFCSANPELRCEHTESGDVVIMPPEGGESGARGLKVGARLERWAERNGTGVAFGSSTGFQLPNGATRSPDAAWVRRTRLVGLTPAEKKAFVPLCPDFVIEIRSPSDSLADQQEKLEEYITNGAALGWLIDPQSRSLWIYQPGEPPKRIDNPTSVAADPVLPGFVLELAGVWDVGF